MEGHHWLMLFVVAGVAYLLGAKYPVLAQRAGF